MLGQRPLLFFAPLALALPLRAQEPAADPRLVQPERPTVATHAHTVAPGYVEIEAGLEADRYAPGRRAVAAPVVTKVGLTSHLSTPAYFAANSIGQSTGVGDIAVGVKWRVLDDNALLGDFAILPAIKFPTGSTDRGTGTGSRDVGLTLISSHAFGPVAMDLNAAYTRLGATSSTSASDAALWTASFGFPVAGRLSWVAELFGAPTIDGSGSPSTVAFLTGPTFLLQPSFNLDLGLITPLHGDMPNAVYAGLVWNVGKLPFGWRMRSQ
jgi:Putative MetA-pathway of phenol degradation